MFYSVYLKAFCLCVQLVRHVVSSSNHSANKDNTRTEKLTKTAVVSNPSDFAVNGSTDKAEKISKAMKAYLEHARAHGKQTICLVLVWLKADLFFLSYIRVLHYSLVIRDVNETLHD